MVMRFDEALKDSKFIVAQCRLKSGTVSGIIVLDVTIAGCMIDRCALSFTPEQRLLIKLPGLEFVGATVSWVDGDKAGLMFERPLYEPVLNHLLKAVGKLPQAA